jgi:hypothetical protein
MEKDERSIRHLCLLVVKPGDFSFFYSCPSVTQHCVQVGLGPCPRGLRNAQLNWNNSPYVGLSYDGLGGQRKQVHHANNSLARPITSMQRRT